MTWARVQSKSVNASATSSVTVTFTSTPTTGNKVIVFVAHSAGGTPNLTSCVDGNSVALTSLATPVLNGTGSTIVGMYAYDVPGAPSSAITVNTGVSGDWGVIVQEISGLLAGNTTAMLDGTAASAVGSGTPTTSPTYSSTALNEYLISFYGDDGAASTATAPGGWTGDANNLNGSGQDDVSVAYKDSTNGAETGQWSLSGGAPNWAVWSVAFKLAGGGGGGSSGGGGNPAWPGQPGFMQLASGFPAYMQQWYRPPISRRGWGWADDVVLSAQNYTQTSTDDTGETDSSTQLVAYARSPPDDSGLTDTVTRVAASIQSQTDNAGLTDTESQLAAYAPTNTDPAGLTDSTAQTVAYVRAPTDDAGLIDPITPAATYLRTAATDDIGLTDSVTVLKLLAVTITDDTGIIDSSSRVVAAAQTVTDPAGLTDTASQVVAYTRAPTDDTGLTDAMSQASGAAGQTFTDPAGLTDSVTQLSATARAATDDTGVTDSRTQAVNYNITITDSAGLTDLVVKEFARILTELAALTDTTSWITVFRPTFTDDTGLTDLAVATGSSVTIIVPPATRILIVYPENRIDTIPAETRTGPIAADPRLLTTAVDPRIEVVPQEDRLMPAQYLKDSNATLDYGINWAPWLVADTITASAWTVQTGLTTATPAPSFTTTTTTIWLSGGTVGTTYTVTNRVTTAAGRIDDRTFTVEVIDR